MAHLAVNVDHVATLREARGAKYPEPIAAAIAAETAGAGGVVVHLREDRRHIQERDVRILRQIVRTKLILEMRGLEEKPKMLDVGGRRSSYTAGVEASIVISDLPRETHVVGKS